MLKVFRVDYDNGDTIGYRLSIDESIRLIEDVVNEFDCYKFENYDIDTCNKTTECELSDFLWEYEFDDLDDSYIDRIKKELDVAHVVNVSLSHKDTERLYSMSFIVLEYGLK